MNWIRVSEQLPEPGQKVLAAYRNDHKKWRIVLAHHTPPMTEEDAWGDSELDCVYEEETDRYFLPEGWYEEIENWEDIGPLLISEFEITHWMPLPKTPQ